MSGHGDATEYMRWRQEKYARSAFKQHVDQVFKHPALVGEVPELVSFWKFAIEQREMDKDIQDLIAWNSGLRLTARLNSAGMSFEHVDELYEIAFSFSALDHLNNWQGSDLSQLEKEKLNADIDHEWNLLRRRLAELRRQVSR